MASLRSRADRGAAGGGGRGTAGAGRASPTPSSARSCSAAPTSSCGARCRRWSTSSTRTPDARMRSAVRDSRRRRPRPGNAPRREMCGCRRGPTGSGAMRAGSAPATRSSSATANPRPPRPTCRRACRRRGDHGRRASATPISATASAPRPSAAAARSWPPSRSARSMQTLDRLLRVEALVIAGVLIVLGIVAVAARPAQPATARSHGHHRRHRSRAASCRTASARRRRRPRSAGSGWR